MSLLTAQCLDIFTILVFAWAWGVLVYSASVGVLQGVRDGETLGSEANLID
jgi:hypothetical protein